MSFAVDGTINRKSDTAGMATRFERRYSHCDISTHELAVSVFTFFLLLALPILLSFDSPREQFLHRRFDILIFIGIALEYAAL
jgi:hypothetical protein